MRSTTSLALALVGAAVAATAAAPAIAAASIPSPARVVAQAQREWRADLLAAARNGDRDARFPSPPRGVLMRRLHGAQAAFRFRIVSVKMLHPLQAAPVIVIRSDREHAIARATPKIVA